MRSDIFLHFLNRDSREIFGLYHFQNSNTHARLLRRALNACVSLCEDRCVLPPGFVVEDDIAFGLAETQRAYLSERILQFPIRESNLADYAEKKRSEYQPMRSRYSGLFDDSRVDFIGRHAQGLIHRKTFISEKIIQDWEAGPDRKLAAWAPIRKSLQPATIEHIRRVPAQLADQGTAQTWSAIAPLLNEEASIAGGYLRNALQYTYLKQYCSEFDLIILAAIPYMIEEFNLPHRISSYSYQRFEIFLRQFHLSNFIFDATAELLIDLKRRPGFTAFIDAYVELAERQKTNTNLMFFAGKAATACSFDWEAFGKRHNVFVSVPRDFELLELDGALSEVANQLSLEHELSRRGATSPPIRADFARRKRIRMPEIVLYVALEEELRVLCKALGLTRNHDGPAATGTINGQAVAVLCPLEMGRVAAAVEVATYLQSRKANLPELLLIVGLAGGFPEEGTQPGHIICASTVVDLGNRKVIEDESGVQTTKFRRRDFDLDNTLWKLITSDAFDRDKWISESIELAEWPDDRRPSLHTGLLTSVDEVVASDEWRGRLLKHTEKLLGVEMEAGGACLAARRLKVPVSMLRVVSDNADPAKADDKWRSIGMKTLAHLLKSIPYDALRASIKG